PRAGKRAVDRGDRAPPRGAAPARGRARDRPSTVHGPRRRQPPVRARWEAAGLARLPALLEPSRFDEAPATLAAPGVGEEIIADYQSLGIPMGTHPVALLRRHLDRFGVRPASELADYPD